MKLRYPAMVRGVRGRLFLASLGVVSIVILIVGLAAHVETRAFLEARIEAELAEELAAARVAAEAVASGPDDALADRLGGALRVRVSFIDDEGRVLGDSGVDTSVLGGVDNHADRPEVERARETGLGRDRRTSNTLRKDMLYLAQPYSRADGARGVVRVAADYGEVDAVVDRVRLAILATGALGLLAAVVISAAASQVLSRTLRELVVHARGLSGERFGDDEIGGLAGTLQRLAGDLGRAVTSLAAERDRSAAVLEAMVEGVIGLDADGSVIFVNPAARALLHAPADGVGKTLLELARVPALDEAAQRARRGEVAAVEVELHAPQPRILLVRAAPVRAGGAVVVLHDVTEVRRLERVRRDFIANVSHELRTPVSVIRANAETLLLGGLDDRARARGFVDAIDRNAERLARLLGDLLDLSRIEAGQVKLVLELLPLRALVLRAVEQVETRARERGHTVTVEVDEGMAAAADEKALDQVLVNLLENAVKYTPPGGHVVVRARAAGRVRDDRDGERQRVRLEVEDDGPGVEPQHRSRLFERFYRVDPGRSRDVGGTGLGLAIVKHLVEAMGGKVGVEPAAARGSVFWVELPAEVAVADRDEFTSPSQT